MTDRPEFIFNSLRRYNNHGLYFEDAHDDASVKAYRIYEHEGQVVIDVELRDGPRLRTRLSASEGNQFAGAFKRAALIAFDKEHL